MGQGTLCRKAGRCYEILEDGDRVPYKIPKAAADRALADIRGGLQKVNGAIQRLRGSGAYHFVMGRVLPYGLAEDDGKVWALREMEESAAELAEFLAAHDDDIPKPEQTMLLEDYGYRQVIGERIWEKQIRDDDEATVTEEILPKGDGADIRRVRTILWDVRPGVKSSKSIRYAKLRMGKRLLAACEATRRRNPKLFPTA